MAAGAIDATIYSVVVGMAIVTTLIVPPFLPALVRRAEDGPKTNAPPAGAEGAP